MGLNTSCLKLQALQNWDLWFHSSSLLRLACATVITNSFPSAGANPTDPPTQTHPEWPRRLGVLMGALAVAKRCMQPRR